MFLNHSDKIHEDRYEKGQASHFPYSVCCRGLGNNSLYFNLFILILSQILLLVLGERFNGNEMGREYVLNFIVSFYFLLYL